MSLKAKNSGSGDFESAPPGLHPCRCIQVIDLGLQESTGSWGTKIQPQVLVRFELPNTLMEDGRPFMMSKFYTSSTSEKANLRKDLLSWRGRDLTQEEEATFDIASLLGMEGMLNAVVNKNDKVVVGSLSPVMQGLTIPTSDNAFFAFDIDAYLAGDPKQVAEYVEFSDWLKGKINLDQVLPAAPRASIPQSASGQALPADAGPNVVAGGDPTPADGGSTMIETPDF